MSVETGKWCWSINQENYHGCHDTEETAHGEAQDELDNERGPGDKAIYWIARTCNPLDLVSAELLGEDIDEQVECRMADEYAAEDYILEMSKDHKTALGELVIAYIREHGSINYYSVTDVKEHKYVVQELE